MSLSEILRVILTPGRMSSLVWVAAAYGLAKIAADSIPTNWRHKIDAGAMGVRHKIAGLWHSP
jgi:hypothetical protein